MRWMGSALLRIWLVLALFPAFAASAATVQAIEYYHAAFDHYFVTANADEIAKLDSGYFSGWQRTGQAFAVSDAATPLPGGNAVCRFYGNPQAGLDSHFYSASASECAAVQANFPNAWLLESSNVFQVYLPDTSTGACPAGSVPIYRAWNGRADSNHRYTTSASLQQAMIAKGYVAEGYGSASKPVAMCSPTGAPGAVPECTLTASNRSPEVGTTISLTASCSGSPTEYIWSGCSSSGSTCAARSDISGNVTYGVTARNAAGSGPTASVDVGWHEAAAPLPAPACVLSATTQGARPVAGTAAVLNATCTNLPSSYAWSGCNGTASTCYVSESSAGTRAYGVTASNRSGASAPVSVNLDWTATATAPPDFCGSFPSLLYSVLPWANNMVRSVDSPYPSFAWNGAWVARFTVPSSVATPRAGSIDVVEYAGGPLSRQVTISQFACDFRATDPSGQQGPIFSSTSTAVSAPLRDSTAGGGVVLQPGQTYYVNVRNLWQDGSISCPEATESCGASISMRVPSQ